MITARIHPGALGVALAGTTRVIRRLAHVSKEPSTRARILWLAVGIGIDVTLIGIGAGYALAGKSAAVAPDVFTVLLKFIPFGLYGHGWIMVVLGTSNLWGLAQVSRGAERMSWRIVKITSRAILFYSFVVAFCLIGSIWVTNQYSGGFWWYLFMAVLAGAFVSLPPQLPMPGVPNEVERV
jgi:hypothetical protein